MEWPATSRYDLAPAPAGLVLVQEFLNTAPRPRPETPDLLGTVGGAQAWSEAAMRQWAERTGTGHRRVRLRKADVDALRDMRAGLARAFRVRRGMNPNADAGDVPLVRLNVSTVVGADAGVTLEPSRDGWENLASAVAIEAYRAQVADQWRRLKICRNPFCPGVFYDRSPNNSGVWHDVRTCGNVANLHASRARRKATARP
jgi:predicted RNA-binding Zn ribbon-like protein